MATIKSYTSVEQSRKLAEILPLETADMEYLTIKKNGASVGSVPFVKDDSEVENSAYNHVYDRIACWSLASLIGVIKEQGLVDLRFLRSTFDNRGNHLTNVWCCTFEDIGTVTIDLYADNPVDACVDMILQLHKLNIL